MKVSYNRKNKWKYFRIGFMWELKKMIISCYETTMKDLQKKMQKLVFSATLSV
jgi:hypothetical protein